MPIIRYDRVAARVTRLEQSLAAKLNPPVEGSEWKRPTAEDHSPEDLIREMAIVAETSLGRIAARLDAAPSYLPPLRTIIRIADRAVRLHRLVFGEDSLRSRHDAQRSRNAKESARNLINDWAQGQPPDLRQEIVDSLKLFDEIL